METTILYSQENSQNCSMKKIAQKFLNLSEFTRFFMTNEIKNKIISRFVLLFIQLYLREIFIGMDGSQNYSSSKLTKMPYLKKVY